MITAQHAGHKAKRRALNAHGMVLATNKS